MKPFTLSFKRRGFTLIETMLASGLFLMATGMVISAAYVFQLSTRQEKVQNELERQATGLMDYLQRDLNLASKVLTTWGAYTTSGTSMIVEIPVFDANEIRVPNTIRCAIYEYLPTEDGAGSVARLEVAPHDTSDPSATPQVQNYQVIAGITDFQLYFDHLDYASLLALGTPLEDVRSVEVGLTLETEKDERIYERDYLFSVTLRN